MKTPFRIVPWSESFLDAVRRTVDELTEGNPGRAVVVFPHSRPRRYLTDLYLRLNTAPAVLPRMLTGEELRGVCLAAWVPVAPFRQAALLDQAALMKQSVESVAAALPPDSPLATLAAMLKEEDGMARFFPWGVRLAALMEECLAQMVDARDLLHAEGEVEPFAAALLAELRGIRAAYLNGLDTAKFTTPGRDAHLAARRAEQNPPLPPSLEGKAIVLAGFVSLTRSENILYRYFWERGATVCLHTDPQTANGRGHWSCGEHVRWMRNWKAGSEVSPGSTPAPHEPHLHLFAGYDLHSQLKELQRVIDEGANGESRAVVLPVPDLLMPALHHLPRKDINISLGYPLARSPLARLVETLLRATEDRRCPERGVCGSEPEGVRLPRGVLLDIVRHPYVRMLRSQPEQDGSGPAQDGARADNNRHNGSSDNSFLPLLNAVEKRLKDSGRSVRLSALLDGMAVREGETDAALFLREVMTTLASGPDRLSPRGMAEWLGRVCALLLEHGRPMWDRFPLDAECLYRLMRHVIPQLAENAMADELLTAPTLAGIVRQSLDAERVPFEADPLTGLQVLGMLETRLLRFDRVYLLDVTEDRLPGQARQDPLLPDSLRGLLGLPDNGRRDELAAHTFHRLIAGANDVFLFWQEGVESSGLLDSKKIRSRFVEEALWRQEQAEKKRLRPGQDPWRAASFPPCAPSRQGKTPIAKTPAIRARLEALLAEPLAPNRLDSYLNCPARFFYEHVCRIRTQNDMGDGDDPVKAGELLHNTLRRAYEPLAGSVVTSCVISVDHLTALFREELAASGLPGILPAESLFMLEAAGPLRLERYLNAQPEELIPLHVEKAWEAPLSLPPRPHGDVNGATGEAHCTLMGRFDRVDRRPCGDMILDYKTGGIPVVKAALWDNDELWNALESWTPGGHDPLPALADALPSVQLPCYLYVYTHAKNAHGPKTGLNAAWVRLASDGKEVPLLHADWTDSERGDVLDERIPALLRFLITHMRDAPAFTPRPGKRCSWCPYADACG